MKKIHKEGGVSDGAMVRMLHLLGQACEDGADGVIITCTVFSAYVKAFNELFSVPIIAADDAMMQQAGALGGNTLLLCTFPGTKEASSNLLRRYLDQSGKPYTLDTVVLEDALTHANQGDFATHNTIIGQHIMANDTAYDHIVLAQISMADVATEVTTTHATVFTSPKSAYETLCNILA